MVGDNYFDTQNAVTQKKKNDRIWKWKIIHCVRTTIQRKKIASNLHSGANASELLEIIIYLVPYAK